jgi:hypothetical protein
MSSSTVAMIGKRGPPPARPAQYSKSDREASEIMPLRNRGPLFWPLLARSRVNLMFGAD